jgi:hypothetical protein
MGHYTGTPIEIIKIMTTLSIRPPDDMAERLKTIAKHRDIRLNKLIFELCPHKSWWKKMPTPVWLAFEPS